MNETEFKSGLDSLMNKYKTAPIEKATAGSLKSYQTLSSIEVETSQSEEDIKEPLKQEEIESNVTQQENLPVQEGISATQESSQNFSEIEQKAIEKGWRPDYEGEGKVDAKTYLDRSPFFERINSQKKEIAAQREALEALTEHFAQKRQEEINAALAQKEAERLAAYKEGNVQVGVAKEAEMRKLHEVAQKDPILSKKLAQPQVTTEEQVLASKPKEVQDFYNKYKNDWFNDNSVENKIMKNTASRISDILAENYQIQGLKVDTATHLKNVEAKMKQEFPHRFGNPNQTLPNAMGRSTAFRSTTPAQANGASLVSRMTDFQLKIAKTVENVSRDKRTGKPSMTVEDYARKLDREGKLKK